MRRFDARLRHRPFALVGPPESWPRSAAAAARSANRRCRRPGRPESRRAKPGRRAAGSECGATRRRPVAPSNRPLPAGCSRNRSASAGRCRRPPGNPHRSRARHLSSPRLIVVQSTLSSTRVSVPSEVLSAGLVAGVVGEQPQGGTDERVVLDQFLGRLIEPVGQTKCRGPGAIRSPKVTTWA